MQPEKKMKRLENRELFQDFNRTIASVLFEENNYPWEVLPKIHDFIMEVGMLLSKDEYEEVKEHVWVAKSAMVAPTAILMARQLLVRMQRFATVPLSVATLS